MAGNDVPAQIAETLKLAPTSNADEFLNWYNENVEPLAKLDQTLLIRFDNMLTRELRMIRGKQDPSEDLKGLVAKLTDIAKSPALGGRRKSRKLGNKFNRCVKSVRASVRARKGSTKESAAIAICTKSVLQTQGKTMKRYRKGRLVTQKKLRGGTWGACS
jgi:hypothetical protein